MGHFLWQQNKTDFCVMELYGVNLGKAKSELNKNSDCALGSIYLKNQLVPMSQLEIAIEKPL